MKLLLLADCNSTHTRKWVEGLSSRGIEILLASLSDPKQDYFKDLDNVQVHSLGFKARLKLRYLMAIPKLKRILKDFQPDLLHAHYATSYGLLGARLKFKPFLLSVWGEDVFDFPRMSPLHRYLFKSNLKKADRILSTSRRMKEEIALYTKKSIDITPFGIDLDKFYPETKRVGEEPIRLVSVKSLELVYRIDHIITAFGLLLQKHPDLNAELNIIGGGSLEQKLRSQVLRLGLEKKVNFTGWVEPPDLPNILRRMTIFVNIPELESFGVSVLEASACGLPVIVTNTGGLPEVSNEGASGIMIPLENDDTKLVNAMEKLALDPDLRLKLGAAGAEFVKEHYDWKDCLSKMMQIYKEEKA